MLRKIALKFQTDMIPVKKCVSNHKPALNKNHFGLKTS